MLVAVDLTTAFLDKEYIFPWQVKIISLFFVVVSFLRFFHNKACVTKVVKMSNDLLHKTANFRKND